MNAIQAIVLGVVQGLTEFLPISSSGHLRIVPALFGWDDPGAAFTAVIQLGTMAAVLLYFRADLWRIATAWLQLAARPLDAGRPRRPDGLVHHPRHDPDRRPRARVQGPDRDEVPQPRADRDDPDPLRARDARRRGREPARPAAAGDHAARRPAHRLRPGAGARPRREPLRRDDLRRPVPQLRSRGRGALLVPALGPGGRALGPVRAAPRGRGQSARSARRSSRRCSRSSRATPRSRCCSRISRATRSACSSPTASCSA